MPSEEHGAAGAALTWGEVRQETQDLGIPGGTGICRVRREVGVSQAEQGSLGNEAIHWSSFFHSDPRGE